MESFPRASSKGGHPREADHEKCEGMEGQPKSAGSILIIDDERDITEPIKTYFETKGYDVSTFNDPIAAVTAFQPGKHDVAIVDLSMPRMDGAEVYRQLSIKDPDLKLGLFTAFDVSKDGPSKGFPDMKSIRVIKKPMSLSTLMGVVDEMLSEGQDIASVSPRNVPSQGSRHT
jgi:two-component system, OmpR family, response regulator ChvI